MFAWLKPRIDCKKNALKSERVDHFACSRILFHWLFSSPRPSSFLLLLRSNLLLRAFSRQLVPPRTLPLLVLSIHIALLRGGGGQQWSGLGLPSSPSHLCPQGMPSSPPLLASTHSSTNNTTKSPSSSPHYSYSFCTYHRGFVRCAVSARVASCECACGQFHCWLGTQWFWLLCATNHFQIADKVKRDCRRTPHFQCVCFGRRQSGSCLLG